MPSPFIHPVAAVALALTLAAISPAAAQTPAPSPAASPAATLSPSPSATPTFFSDRTLKDLRKLQSAALESDYAYRQAAFLSNNIGPRLSGSAQEARAVEYVAAELKSLGLDVRLEKVMVPHWVRGEETAELTEYHGQVPGTTQKVVLTALGSSIATPAEGLTAEVIVANDFDHLEALAQQGKVSGKIVLFNYPFDKRMAEQGHAGPAYGQAVAYRGGAPVAAAKHGAVAALVRSVGSADFRLPHTGNTRYADDVARIPAAAVTSEDADLIAALAPQGPVKMRLLLTPQTLPDAQTYNVIADLKGREKPDEIVVVSGHLDSWDLGTGALDDAVGVAAAMETLYLIRKLKLQPRRTVRFIAWANEENGLRGARTYAETHAAEMPKHVGAIEMDAGGGRPVGIRVKAAEEVREILRPVAKVLQSSGAGVLDVADSGGADIGQLENAGVPGFAPIQDGRAYFHYHHTAADTMDKVDARALAENSAVLAVLSYALADAERPLPRLPSREER